MKNIYAIGDIHGEFNKLVTLISRLNISEEDTLIFLGDYIDRGAKSFEVIDYLIHLDSMYDCVFLSGNHEAMFMDFLSGINGELFLYNGGRKTVSSYIQNICDVSEYLPYQKREIPPSHNKFFRNLKKYYETEDFIFVHAGILPGTPLERTPDDILLWDRSFLRMKYEGKTVVCGHTPNRTILNEKHKICVDTGACFKNMGDLTAAKLPERTFIRQGDLY